MGKYPRKKSNRTDAQQAAIEARNARGKFKSEALAFYEVLLGLPSDRTSQPKTDADGNIKRNKKGEPIIPGGKYETFRRYMEELIRCTEEDVAPDQREYGRKAIFQNYKRAFAQVLKIQSAGYAVRSGRTPATDYVKAKVSKTHKPTQTPSEAATFSGDDAMCVVCGDLPAEPGKQHCRLCAESLNTSTPATEPVKESMKIEKLAATVKPIVSEPPILSPRPSGMVPDETSPAYAEFLAAMDMWAEGQQPRPEHFADMQWITPKKPKRAGAEDVTALGPIPDFTDEVA